MCFSQPLQDKPVLTSLRPRNWGEGEACQGQAVDHIDEQQRNNLESSDSLSGCADAQSNETLQERKEK